MHPQEMQLSLIPELGKTWCRVVGEGDRTPIVLLHGGPGYNSEYLRRFEYFALTDRAIIRYDQIGSGRSIVADEHYEDPEEAQSRAEAIVAGLVAGPPENEELRTVVVDPLTGLPLISVFLDEPAETNNPGDVNIALSPEFASLPPNEQVLVLGQVVLSISGSGLGAVAFVDQTGSPVAVPLPDGRLLDRPSTVADYSSLIV